MSERLAFLENKGNIKKIIIIPMESIKNPKRIIKKQLKNVNKAIIVIEFTSAIPLFSRSESFNDLDPLRTTDPPLTWQLAQTFLKIVSPSLISEAIRYLLCKEV